MSQVVEIKPHCCGRPPVKYCNSMTGLLRRGSAASLLALGLCLLCISACNSTDESVKEPAKRDVAVQHVEPVAVSASALVLSGLAATKAGNYSLVSGTYS